VGVGCGFGWGRGCGKKISLNRRVIRFQTYFLFWIWLFGYLETNSLWVYWWLWLLGNDVFVEFLEVET
jgi:hypothetical protein